MEKNINCDKMIIAILQGDDYRMAIDDLNDKGFYVTVLNSSGGFLKMKSVTLLIGVNHEHLAEAIEILKHYGKRIEIQYQANTAFANGAIPSAALTNIPAIKVPYMCGGVVLFVLDVEQSLRA